jgi:hypothetical protein
MNRKLGLLAACVLSFGTAELMAYTRSRPSACNRATVCRTNACKNRNVTSCKTRGACAQRGTQCRTARMGNHKVVRTNCSGGSCYRRPTAQPVRYRAAVRPAARAVAVQQACKRTQCPCPTGRFGNTHKVRKNCYKAERSKVVSGCNRGRCTRSTPRRCCAR